MYKPCIFTPDYVLDFSEARPSSPSLTQSNYTGLPCAPQIPARTLVWRELAVPSQKDSSLRTFLILYCPTLSPLSVPLPHAVLPGTCHSLRLLLICIFTWSFSVCPICKEDHMGSNIASLVCCCIPSSRGVPRAGEVLN